MIHLRLDEDFSHLPSANFLGKSLIPGEHSKTGQGFKFLPEPGNFPVWMMERNGG
jgi:hypothetical protein